MSTTSEPILTSHDPLPAPENGFYRAASENRQLDILGVCSARDEADRVTLPAL
jgi:hypothetical protein